MALEPCYLGYFEAFNQGLFFEAHEILEPLWLAQRRQRNNLFYKGLIQLAGAFVHLRKNRIPPAVSLFRLARTNLEPFAPIHQQLEVESVVALINFWNARLEASTFEPGQLEGSLAPRLRLAMDYGS